MTKKETNFVLNLLSKMALKAGTKCLSNNKSPICGDVPLKVLKKD